MQWTLCAALVVASLAVSASAGPQAEPAPPAVVSPTVPAAAELRSRFSADTLAPAAIEAGRARLAKTAAAYRDAPGLSDVVEISMLRAGAPAVRDSFSLTLGAGTDATLTLADAVAYAADGTVTFVPRLPKDKALRGPIAGPDGSLREASLLTSMARLIPGFVLPVPHFALRASDPATSPPLDAFVFGTLASPALIGYREADGAASVLVEGAGGAVGVLDIAADTSLYRAARFVIPVEAPAPANEVVIDLSFTPTVAATPSAVHVDVEGRTIVASIADLMPTRVTVGSPCPAFAVTLADGSTLTNESLRGKVAILAFVALWDPPSRRLLPYVEQTATWAGPSGMPIMVSAIDTRENGDASARRRTADEYWKAQGFTMPLGLDIDDSASMAFGFDGLPVIVVLAPNGAVAHIHTGVDPRNPGAIVEALKAQATSLAATVKDGR